MFLPNRQQQQRGKPDKTRGLIVEGAELIACSLANWFGYEQPPADRVSVVPGTLKYIDPFNKVAKASVRTEWDCNDSTKQHVSLVRFKHDNQFRVIARTLSFA